MRTAYLSHSDCLHHDAGNGHPESPSRLYAISDRLLSRRLSDALLHADVPEVTQTQLARVHDPDYLAALESVSPRQGQVQLDPDTVMSPGTLAAARRAAGAVVAAVDLLMSGDAENAFCAVRPPGHHAERSRAMGFCLYNNIAVGAAHALEAQGLRRIGIVDFDVHQGNGTEQIFKDDERVIFCSTFQHPFYPHTPLTENTHRMVSVPLPASSGSDRFRAAIEDHWLPAKR